MAAATGGRHQNHRPILLFGLRLICHGGCCFGGSLWVTKVGMTDWPEIIVQLVQKGNASGNIQLGDVFVADAVEILDESPYRIPMRRHDDFLSCLHRWSNRPFPEWDKAGHGVLQTFSQRKIGLGHISIAGIMSRPTFVGLLQSRRLRTVTATPQLDLGLAILLCRFSLVESLQSSIVTLVETPAADLGDPHEVHFIQNDPQCADGSLQY